MNSLAVVVLSGGLDSATALGIAHDRHGPGNVHAITFEYGQRHAVEINAAEALCAYYLVPQSLIPLPASLFKGGVLTTDEEVPDMKYSDLASGTMSPTYVPFRNGNLISMAVAKADSMLRTEQILSTDSDGEGEVMPRWDDALVYAGMHSEDAAGFAYADCTPEFLGAMASAIYIGTYGKVRLQALFQHMTKVQIIEEGWNLEVPYGLTHSCYRGMSPACGRCSTCHARLEAFTQAGITDPIDYAEGVVKIHGRTR